MIARMRSYFAQMSCSRDRTLPKESVAESSGSKLLPPVVLNANRLNVAISRAKCLSIVVGSPELANCMPKNVEEAKQLSRFCKILRYMDQD